MFYEESYPLAMDAALVSRNHQNGTNDMRRSMALDMDTALEDGQWEKLKAHLSGKLSPEDMEGVENICRKGGDAPKPGEDLKRPRAGAADINLSRAYDTVIDGEEETLRARHRAGAISEGQLAQGLRSLRSRRRAAPPPSPPMGGGYDARMFPHAGRLK